MQPSNKNQVDDLITICLHRLGYFKLLPLYTPCYCYRYLIPYNAKVKNLLITWPTNLIYSTTFSYLISNQLALLEKRSPTRFRSISSLEDYLQINAFLISSGKVEKNLLQLKATEN